MLIGRRLREIRVSKRITQAEIRKRTGLHQCYTSRVENGQTVPSVATLEKYARGLEIPIHELFHDGKGPMEKPRLSALEGGKDARSLTPTNRRELGQFATVLSKMSDRNRKLLLSIAQRFANKDKNYDAKEGKREDRLERSA